MAGEYEHIKGKGNRFSSTNQPPNRGRKPKLYTIAKKAYGDALGDGEGDGVTAAPPVAGLVACATMGRAIPAAGTASAPHIISTSTFFIHVFFIFLIPPLSALIYFGCLLSSQSYRL